MGEKTFSSTLAVLGFPVVMVVFWSGCFVKFACEIEKAVRYVSLSVREEGASESTQYGNRSHNGQREAACLALTQNRE